MVNIGSGNGLVPFWCQAITWANADQASHASDTGDFLSVQKCTLRERHYDVDEGHVPYLSNQITLSKLLSCLQFCPNSYEMFCQVGACPSPMAHFF